MAGETRRKIERLLVAICSACGVPELACEELKLRVCQDGIEDLRRLPTRLSVAGDKPMVVVTGKDPIQLTVESSAFLVREVAARLSSCDGLARYRWGLQVKSTLLGKMLDGYSSIFSQFPALFISSNDLSLFFDRALREHEGGSFVDALVKKEILVVDDLGGLADIYRWLAGTIISKILYRRFGKGRLTVMTTHEAPVQIESKLGKKAVSLIKSRWSSLVCLT